VISYLKATRRSLGLILNFKAPLLKDGIERIILDQRCPSVPSVPSVAIETEVAALLVPFRPEVELLVTMPGLSETSASVILAEIGFDMSHFPSAENLISWAGLCPRCDESAGKRRSTRIRQGDPWLKETLVQCAWAAVRTHDSHFAAMFHRIKVRQGAKKAIVAVAAEMLRSAWYMLSRGEVYKAPLELKDDPARREREAKRLVRKLEELGYDAEIRQTASLAS
jgi:hypothetical protein